MSRRTVDLPAPECPVRKANSPLAMWKETSFSARPPLGKALKTLVNWITYACASARAKSAMRSSASSNPRENLKNPSGMPASARCAGVSDAWEVRRGSDTSVSTPPRLGAWAAIVGARRERCGAAARQGLHAAIDQPRGHGVQRLAPHLHQPAHLLDHRFGSGDGARDHVRMAVEIFGRAVDHQIRAVLERAEVHGRGEGRVDDERQALRLAERRE